MPCDFVSNQYGIHQWFKSSTAAAVRGGLKKRVQKNHDCLYLNTLTHKNPIFIISYQCGN